MMKIRIMAVMLAVAVCVAAAYAADKGTKTQPGDLGTKTVSVVTDTTQSAVSGTANIAQTSVKDTVSTPMTAIQAVKDTGATAVVKADAVLKTITGEDKQKGR